MTERAMPRTSDSVGWLARADLQALLDQLAADGRRIVGPTTGDGAVVYDEIHGVDELPHGVGPTRRPGRYRLEQRGDDRLFDYVIGPTAWKRFTFPPRVPLAVGRRDGGAVTFSAVERPEIAYAFLGVRACELAALGIQDRVLMDGPAVDADYAARRSDAFIVAVECVTAATTCFCTSMGTGPEVRDGFDLALTELDDGFVVRVGSPAGTALAERLPLTPARRRAPGRGRGRRRRHATLDRRPGRHRRPAGATARQPRQPALGGGRRALPRLRELHPRLPDLLLHERRPAVRPRRPGIARRAELGQLLHRGLRDGRRRQLPAAGPGSLPPVAHPQVRDLVGPVRDAPAASAAAAASPGARSGSTSATSSTPSPGRARERAPRWVPRVWARRRQRPSPLRPWCPHRRCRRSSRCRRPRRRPRRPRSCRPTSRRRPSAGSDRADLLEVRRLPGRVHQERDAGHDHARPDRRRPGHRGRPARPVRDGRPAGLLGRADLDLALPAGRDRAHDPRRPARDDRDHPPAAGTTSSACAARSAPAGRSRSPYGRDVVDRHRRHRPRAAAARSSTRSSPSARGSAPSGSSTGPGRRPTSCSATSWTRWGARAGPRGRA